MSDLYMRSIQKLELDKVLQMLSGCAGSDAGKKECLNLRPSSDKDQVKELLEETTAASNLSTTKG